MDGNSWDAEELYNNLETPKKRFELAIDGKIAFIEYILNSQGVIYLTHTEVPLELGGKGVGTAIVSKTIAYIKKEGFLLAPLCPFVAAYLKRHPERVQGLLAPGFSIG
ncbi:GNAT family N-acetyltransferase [Eudoraea chungangensis]|uniref:GNAT family N-acetyltransferase n=1 Tax=Eudoraea chungangensis TaxID=1481905 RepID=UPI0023ECF692|nr:GNAT family N-acetyltransferase [Eudoraea chungangensis]